ncbi:GyrI-like domain-containing protein [uncultured Weissella sp.]|uniref:GyrI-like domain-containing protein n=1 Tax=uncultured Weissella sp. TaxID=253243 RepID=UPI0027DCF353|nr:GyrI-like domain-containing protein [uncultured Weissella sp.]
MKFDIKKTSGYHATKKPQILERPGYRCLCINGAGDPNGEDFSVDIQAMYACAYGLKMGYKKSGIKANDFDDYVVPPLQGYWTINERAQKLGTWTKADLVYRLEIVIPEFVPDAFIQETLAATQTAKADVERIDQVSIGTIAPAKICHILHVGPYDDEQNSFDTMHAFINAHGAVRTSKTHREIYLSDARRTAPEKLKTILEVTIAEEA